MKINQEVPLTGRQFAFKKILFYPVKFIKIFYAKLQQ